MIPAPRPIYDDDLHQFIAETWQEAPKRRHDVSNLRNLRNMFQAEIDLGRLSPMPVKVQGQMNLSSLLKPLGQAQLRDQPINTHIWYDHVPLVLAGKVLPKETAEDTEATIWEHLLGYAALTQHGLDYVSSIRSLRWAAHQVALAVLVKSHGGPELTIAQCRKFFKQFSEAQKL